MTKRDELLAVAERCEQTSEGGRYLDADIYEALGFEVLCVPGGPRAIGWRYRPGRGCWQSMQRLTTSLDAAMTLVPERYAIDRLSWWPFVAKGHEDQRMCLITILAVDHEGFWTRGRYKSAASTPALALCAAALRAQAEMEG